MPSVEHPPCAGPLRVSETRTASTRAGADPPRRARRMLCDFLAGLNKLLKLSDFRRGDYFRN